MYLSVRVRDITKVAMMRKFKVEKNSSEIIIYIEGSLDEEFVFSDIELSDKRIIKFDFISLSRINSEGIRNWIRWVSNIETSKTQIIFKNCPIILIEQLNYFKEILPKKAVVESFFVPYFCEELNTGHQILVQNSDVTTKASIQNNLIIDGNNFVLDVMPTYFKFLNYSSK